MNSILIIAIACLVNGVESDAKETAAERDARRLAAQSKQTSTADCIALVQELEDHGSAAKPAIPALVQLLADGRYSQRQAFGFPFPVRFVKEYVSDAARKALVATGIEAVDALSAALKHPQLRVRRQAAFALGRIGPNASSAVPGIVAALNDFHAGVRCYAAWALGEIQEKADTAVPALIAALADRDRDVVIEVAEALRKFGTAAKSALPDLSRLIGRQTRRTQNYHTAVKLLWGSSDFGRLGIPALLLLQEREHRVRAYCELAAGEIDGNAGQAIPRLLRVIEDGRGYPLSCKTPIYARTSYTDSTSDRAYELLVRLGAEAAPAIPKLVAWIKAWNAWSNALQLSAEDQASLESFPSLRIHHDPVPLLGAIGPAAKSAIPLLEEQLDDEYLPGRITAARALAGIDPSNRSAIATLIKLLAEKPPKDPKWDDDIRPAAARALLLFEKRARPAVPALTRLLKGPDSMARLEAARVLGHLAPKSNDWRTPLVSCLRDYFIDEIGLIGWTLDSYDYRESVYDAVGILGKDGLQFVPNLIDAMAGFSYGERHSCDRFEAESKRSVVAMVDQGRSAIPYLNKALLDRNRRYNLFYVVTTLGLFGPDAKTAVPSLIEALHEHEYRGTRAAAAKAIGRIQRDPAKSVPALILALTDERSDVRASAAKALGEFEAAASAAVAPLRMAIKDDYRSVREAAQRSLMRIKRKED